MNCISGSQQYRHQWLAQTRRMLVLLAALTIAINNAGAWQGDDAKGQSGSTYHVEFVVTPEPQSGGARVDMILEQDDHQLREIDMRAPHDQISDVSGDGEVSHGNGRVLWRPPTTGGTLTWFAKLEHARGGASYDAYITPDWAIFRAEDVIPQAASRTQQGAHSLTTLSFNLPRGWSSVTEYFGEEHSYRIDVPTRRFDRPAGWMVLGKIGMRTEEIAGVRVNVAAPVGHGMRRMDIIALLSWTLPDIVRIFPDFPARLTIVGAADPMWRGGLSGPRSLFMHTDRPLLSENGTSTLLHEVFHIAVGRGASNGDDWIVEGLAEFYSLEILRRSGTTSENRFASSMKSLEEWGEDITSLCGERSSGASTARAATIFASLNREIKSSTDNQFSLDDVIRALAASNTEITIDGLRKSAAELLESEAKSLDPDNLPGCEP